MLEKRMKADGIVILLDSTIVKAEGTIAHIESPEGEKEVAFDKLLLALGRRIDLDDLGLERTKVRIDEGGRIITDETMRTDDERIYAVGDITSGPQLAHKAFRQGKVAAECIAGLKSAFDNRAIPMVVFSDPEIAVAGIGKEEAQKLGIKTIIGKMPFSASGKARSINDTEGFVELIADEAGILIGAQVIGPGAGTLIAECALGIEVCAKLEDIASTIHAHPTLPESIAESADDALGMAIHRFSKRKPERTAGSGKR
jgi:dihydrolipoamide dehydrogenase